MQVITAQNVALDYGIINNEVQSLDVTINDQHQVRFGKNSKEIRLIQWYAKDELIQHFNNGQYFFMNGDLIDYRTSAYKGFTHSQSNLEQLAEIIGTNKQNTGAYTQGVKGLFEGSSRAHRGLALGGKWQSDSLNIKTLGRGGEFNNTLSFYWSPFSANIKTSFDVERLVCLNGMTANSPFAVYEAPIISDWKNNLNILSTQLTDKFNHILAKRFNQMSETRANLYDVDKVNQIVTQKDMFHRLKSRVQPAQLDNIRDITSVRKHVGRYYQPNVFADTKRMKRAGSHITQYDLFNIATEVATHLSNNENDVQQLNNMANRLTFDELGKGEQVSINTQSILSSDSDHRRAFFASYH